MIEKQTHSLIRDMQLRSKEMGDGFRKMDYNFRQECGKAQRTVRVLFYQATTACDNCYESIHEGFQCIHDTIASTDEDKAVALKNRCVMVNDWNTGVMSKRSRIEIQTRGEPIQSYEAKLPGKTSAHILEKATVEDRLAPFLEGFDERSLPEQALVDVDLRDSGSDEDDDLDDERDEVSESDDKHWYTRNMARKLWPGQVENEVIVRRKAKDSSFFGAESRQETIDQLIGVFRTKFADYTFEE